MPRMTGKQAFMEMLRAEGVKYIFGNPGTSESAIMSSLPSYPDFEYVLVTQEGVAMGMADGYATARGQPAFQNQVFEFVGDFSGYAHDFSAGLTSFGLYGAVYAKFANADKPHESCRVSRFPKNLRATNWSDQ